MAKFHSLFPDIGMLAGADYSGSANRYLFASLSASPDTVVTATGGSLPAPIGILQTTACANMGIRLRTPGQFSKLRVQASTCAINIGNYLTSSSVGYGEKVTAASAAFSAIAMEAVASGSALIEVYLTIPSTTNAAS